MHEAKKHKKDANSLSSSVLALSSGMTIPTSDWDDEEYAEQIRLNRWTQLHKEPLPTLSTPTASETAAKAAKVLAQQQKKQRIRLDNELKQEAEYRANYFKSWQTLNSTQNSLRFTSFTWPVYPPLPLPPLSYPSPQQLAKPHIRRFLTAFIDSPLPHPAKRSNSTFDTVTSSSTPSATSTSTLPDATKSPLKTLIRKTLLLYHPDRFAPLLDRIADSATRERVSQLANVATENLSTLLKELASEEKEEQERRLGEGVLEDESDRRRRKRRKESEREDWDESARVWDENEY